MEMVWTGFENVQWIVLYCVQHKRLLEVIYNKKKIDHMPVYSDNISTQMITFLLSGFPNSGLTLHVVHLIIMSIRNTHLSCWCSVKKCKHAAGRTVQRNLRACIWSRVDWVAVSHWIEPNQGEDDQTNRAGPNHVKRKNKAGLGKLWRIEFYGKTPRKEV